MFARCLSAPPLAAAVAGAVLLCGCSSIIKQPTVADATPPLAVAADERVEAAIESLLVRDAKGAWVAHADWDQYALRIKSRGAPVEVRQVFLVDATGIALAPSADRSALVDGAHALVARYQSSDKLVRSRDGRWAFVGGAAGVYGGVALASAVAPAVYVTGAASLLLLPIGLVVTGAVYSTIGISRMVDNRAVAMEIERRATRLPTIVAADGEQSLVFFYPLAPLPRSLDVVYAVGAVEHRMSIDTREALSRAHAPPSEPPTHLISSIAPEFPVSAMRAGVTEGRVRGRLAINRSGSVAKVTILESQPPGVFDYQARTTWRYFRYSRSSDTDREVDETLLFKAP